MIDAGSVSSLRQDYARLVEHIESQAYNGYAVVRIYPSMSSAMAQVTATMNTALRQMPPGMFPPNALKFDATSVPAPQLGASLA